MKVSTTNNVNNPVPKKTTNDQHSGFLPPPIPLERPALKILQKDKYLVMKLQSDPKKATSPIYKLNVPYFKNGTVEEWMKFLDNLEKVIIRQDLSTGPTQFSMSRRLLSGDTLAQFNNKALALKNKETIQQAKNKKEGEDIVTGTMEDIETHDNLKKCLQAVTTSVLPPQALQTQK